MKQGITFALPVEFDIELEGVERIEFLFSQREKIGGAETTLRFEYPSELAQRREDTNIVDLLWSESETWRFSPSAPLLMDTRIFVKGSITQPQTPIIRLSMSSTLFERMEGAP